MTTTMKIEPSPAARNLMVELSALCGKYRRRVSPSEMTVALAYTTGWSLAGVAAHEKLRPAIDDNIRDGHKAALDEIATRKIAGAVKRATSA